MALMRCPDCGTQVSDAAERCPSCARPIAGMQLRIAGGRGTSVLLKVLGIVLIVFVLFLFLIVVEALGAIGRPGVLSRPVWVPAPTHMAVRPVPAAIALVLSVALVAGAVHFGRRKRKTGA